MSLTEACRHGYWFCERCLRIVKLPLDADSPASCPKCRHRTAVWMPPAFRDPFPFGTPESRKPDPVS